MQPTSPTEDSNQSAEDILLGALDATADEQLASLALRLVLTDHVSIPRENTWHFLKPKPSSLLHYAARKKFGKFKKPTLVEAQHSKNEARSKSTASLQVTS
ncbi:MAG: hypothetical protein M3Y50_16575 [Acidobacteriota bacterium]|nr:hypothetical protein [Acidobacteriota bacterium]